MQKKKIYEQKHAIYIYIYMYVCNVFLNNMGHISIICTYVQYSSWTRVSRHYCLT